MNVATTALRVRRIVDDAILPSRAHADDAGFDLHAAEEVELTTPGARADVGTGVAVELPAGWVGLVCPRSGLAARYGVGIVNAPGVVDAGYRGEIRVLLQAGDQPLRVHVGDRIAQLVLVPCFDGAVVETDELASGSRGASGFGSTGGFG